MYISIIHTIYTYIHYIYIYTLYIHTCIYGLTLYKYIIYIYTMYIDRETNIFFACFFYCLSPNSEASATPLSLHATRRQGGTRKNGGFMGYDVLNLLNYGSRSESSII